MSQLSYPKTLTPAFEGMISDNGPVDIVTGVSEEASAEIPFGVAVAFGGGTNDDGVKLPAAATALIRGVVVHSHNHSKGDGGDLGSTGLKPKSCFDVMRKGRIRVKVEEAVIPGDRAYIRYAGSGQKGAFRKSEVAGETLDYTAECVFTSTTAINGIATVDVNFTNS